MTKPGYIMKLLHSYLLYPINVLDSFYQPGARPAGPKIAFMFSVCLYICMYVYMYMCVCSYSSANITCAKLRHSVTMPRA